MRVLILHNTYQQKGGEDSVVAAKSALLRESGVDVTVEIVDNAAIQGLAAKARTFVFTPHDPARVGWAEAMVRKTKADIVHIHNFFPLLTPAVHEGARRGGAAVVQTLHNYRMLCANAYFLRDGAVCEQCLTAPFMGVVHKCYRGSYAGSLALTRMQMRAKHDGAWSQQVDRFVALTNFARSKFIQGGLPGEKITVKANFVPNIPQPETPRRGALFVGRISPEKGVEVLMRAWKALPDFPLRIIGDGPQRAALQAAAPPNVEFLGQMPADAVRRHMASAEILVMPSIWYEGFPMTLLEAFSTSLPVVASRIGSLTELIEDGVNGALFNTGDAEDLAAKVSAILADGRARDLGRAASETWAANYTPQANLRALQAVYAEALAHRHGPEAPH